MSKLLVSEMAQSLRELGRPVAYLGVADAFTRDVARATLRAEGYHIVAASCGEELAELCDISRPELIVLDQEALLHVAPETAPTIVLLTLQSARRDDVRRVRESPADAQTMHVATPFSPLELMRAVRRVRRLARPRVEAAPVGALARSGAQA